jgi:hypothetical protein
MTMVLNPSKKPTRTPRPAAKAEAPADQAAASA